MNVIKFFTEGIPQTKGSTKGFARGKRVIITNTNEKEKPWAEAIKWAYRAKYKTKPLLEGPIILDLRFNFLKPKSAPKKRKYHIFKPDLDKLVRSAKDALTGIVYNDDSQVVVLKTLKRYSSKPGLEVILKEIPTDQKGKKTCSKK